MNLFPLLRLSEKELRFTLLFVTFIGGGMSYELYYLESLCSSGNLALPLSSSGPLSAGILKATLHTSYSVGMSCSVRLQSPLQHFVMVSVREIGFRTQFDSTCKDYIKIGKIFCSRIVRLDEELHFQSTNNEFGLFYHTASDLDNRTMTGYPGFTLTFTAFQKDGDCNNKSDSFQCSNGNCIWSGLICDGHNNCGDLSDEEPGGSSKCGSPGKGTTVLMILGVLIVFVLVVMCIATLCSKNETVRRFSTRLRSRTISFIPKLSR